MVTRPRIVAATEAGTRETACGGNLRLPKIDAFGERREFLAQRLPFRERSVLSDCLLHASDNEFLGPAKNVEVTCRRQRANAT
jgi:hypothetical protein